MLLGKMTEAGEAVLLGGWWMGRLVWHVWECDAPPVGPSEQVDGVLIDANVGIRRGNVRGLVSETESCCLFARARLSRARSVVTSREINKAFGLCLTGRREVIGRSTSG